MITPDQIHAFYQSCREGNLAAVNAYLDLLRQEDPHLEQANAKIELTIGVNRACHNGHLDIVKVILAQGAHAILFDLSNPLTHAGKGNHLPVIDFLLNNPAVPMNNSRNDLTSQSSKINPLSAAMRHPDQEALLRFLARNPNNWSLFHAARAARDLGPDALENVKMLIAYSCKGSIDYYNHIFNQQIINRSNIFPDIDDYHNGSAPAKIDAALNSDIAGNWIPILLSLDNAVDNGLQITKEELEAAWTKYLPIFFNNATTLYSIVVGVSDGILDVKDNMPEQDIDKARFYNIAKKLPIELQMILCQRAYGSKKDSITAVQTNEAMLQLYNKKRVDVLFKSKEPRQEVQEIQEVPKVKTSWCAIS